MINKKKEYFINKILSLLIIFSIIYVVSLFNISTISKWSILLLLMVISGQGHFATSGVYQYLTFKKKLPKQKNQIIFLGISVLLIVVFSFIYLETKFAAYGLIFITGYFIFHTFINEGRMHQEHFGTSRKTAMLWAFYLIFLSIFLFLPIANTSSFTSVLSLNLLPAIGNENFASPIIFLPTYILILSLIATVLALILLILYTYKYEKEKAKFQSGIAILIFILALMFRDNIGKISFAYFISFAVIYHFITWFIFYYNRVNWQKSTYNYFFTKKGYLTLNITLNLIIIVIAFLVIGKIAGLGGAINYYYFSLQFFLIWTFAHITTTLINEPEITESLLKI